ncbi:syntaxin-1A-like isoform X4 [Convolutriloba macropyga]|uniref:syntaxin-1A-like isoform X4 n=1 Tax=Convolutriloba macropyga TaxID=536237 RepID=UPI003F52324D
MKDRLSALKANGGEDDDDNEVALPMDGNSKFMEDFFSEVDKILQSIDSIHSKVEKVKELHDRMLASPQAEDQDKNELENLMNEIKSSANRVRKSLKTMESNIEKSEAQDREKSSADLRIRKTQHSTLSRKFIEVMSDYNKTQNDYREGCKNRIQRQLEITGKITTSDELEQMLDSDNPNVFSQQIVMDDQQARQALDDVQQRHQEILKLENSIKELHDMFMDMAMLVESQGDMIERIEYNVGQSVVAVKKANVELVSAIKYQKSSRKKQVMIGGVVGVVGIAIALILTFLVF